MQVEIDKSHKKLRIYRRDNFTDYDKFINHVSCMQVR